jgi:basic membrane lipoprotein Med (substrate-binding protein (PBP1-ABC) superfamily)/DNA-binding SARP family transcriptional activator
VEFRVLGSLAAVADGAAAELGPPKQRALLAVLLMRVGEIVPVDQLIELLWGESAPRTAPHSIQIYVSDLRRALEPVGGGDLIVTRPPGYVLDADRDSIDAWRFERLVHDGAQMLDSGDQEHGREALQDAMALWHGPALSDFAYDEFAQPYIRRLTDMHLDAIEILASAELEGGRAAEAIGMLTTAVREDPLRERSRELLMLALYRAGRHADALRTFDQLRTQLADELGLDPSPQLRTLYDRILLHDPALLPERAPGQPPEAARNPYKGLRSFTEADAGDFFGRDRLIDQLLETLQAGARLVSLVGPSGSGKSSVVAAGLMPSLREGAVPGSEDWRMKTMVPAAHPVQDFQALIDSGVDLLVVDQFEQAFVATDADARDHFLQTLADAVSEPDSGLRVVLTLRADFYDRPLLHPAFAAVFTPSVVNVVPMSADELEAAIVEPARQVSVEVEPALLAELVADTADRPGSLPLLQHALTELFDRRDGPKLTRASFARLGGLRGLLSRRAESLFLGLDPAAREASVQVFLRLVRAGDGTGASRRRVAVRELSDLGIDPVALSAVLTTFGQHRLLTFDRDAASGDSTVEVAHEALLFEWERLAGWIEQHRADLRRHAALQIAAAEWERSGRNPDYLFTGSRLREYEPWLTGGVLQLSGHERAFLEAAVEERRAAALADASRVDAQHRRERSARRRFIGLAVVVFVLAGGLSYALLVGVTQARRTVALVTSASVVDEIMEEGFDRGVADFQLVSRKARIQDASQIEDTLRDLSDSHPALVVVGPAVDFSSVAVEYPETDYLLFSWPGDAGNIHRILFREWEGAFLAGVAAARTTETGTIGFIGGIDFVPIWGFQAGYAAGALRVDPNVTILTSYLGPMPHVGDESISFDGYADQAGAQAEAERMYADGADVIFQAAGEAGLGVFDAAVEQADTQPYHLWVIGVDSDQYETVTQLPGVTKADAWRSHILTSMIKRFDAIVYGSLQRVAAGESPVSSQVFDLASGMLDISYSGGFIDDLRPEIENYRRQIIAGDIVVPCIPTDRVDVVRNEAPKAGLSFEELVGGLCP